MSQQKLNDDPYFEIRKSTEKERAEIKRIFRRMDDFGDGRLSVREIERAVQYLGFNPTDAEMEGLVDQDDVDKDGYISYHEFEKVMMKAISRADYERQNIINAFRMFDKNGDGFITARELKAILSASGGQCVDEEVKDLMMEADVNKDGKISYEEFATMFSQKC